MVNDKLIAVDVEVHSLIASHKIIPKEPYGDCLKRLLIEYLELKGLAPCVAVSDRVLGVK